MNVIVSSFLFNYMSSTSLVPPLSSFSGWYCNNDKSRVELNENVSAQLKCGKLTYSLLKSIKDLEDHGELPLEDDMEMMQSTGNAARTYNWTKIFKMLENEFHINLTNEMKYKVLNGESSSVGELLDMLQIIVSSSGKSTPPNENSNTNNINIDNNKEHYNNNEDNNFLEFNNNSEKNYDIEYVASERRSVDGKKNKKGIWEGEELDKYLADVNLIPLPSNVTSLKNSDSISGVSQFADNIIDLLSLSFAHHTDIEKNMAFEIITKHLNSIMKKFDENYLQSWYNELHHSVKEISTFVIKDPKSAALVLEVFGVGLSAVRREIIVACALSLSKLAAMWNLGLNKNPSVPIVSFAASTWDWLVTFGLHRVLVALNVNHGHKKLNTNDRSFLLYIIHSYGNIAYQPLFEGYIQPILGNVSLYFTFLNEYIETLGDTILAFSPNLINYAFIKTLKFLEEEKHSYDEVVLDGQINAMLLLAKLWNLFPIFVEEDSSLSPKLIAALTLQCSSLSPRVRLTSLSIFITLFEEFNHSKNPFAPTLWQKILLIYLEHRSEDEIHDFLALNIQSLLKLYPKLPINGLIIPLIRQTATVGYDNTDFEFFLALASHVSLQETQGGKLLSYMGTIGIHDACFSRLASVIFLVLLVKFEHSAIVKESFFTWLTGCLSYLSTNWSSCDKYIPLSNITIENESEELNCNAKSILIIEFLAKISQLTFLFESVHILILPLVNLISGDIKVARNSNVECLTILLIELFGIYNIPIEEKKPPSRNGRLSSPNLKHRRTSSFNKEEEVLNEVVKKQQTASQIAVKRVKAANSTPVPLTYVPVEAHSIVRKYEAGLKYIFHSYSSMDNTYVGTITFGERASQSNLMGLGELNRCLKDIRILPSLVTKTEVRSVFSLSCAREGKGANVIPFEQFVAVCVSLADIALGKKLFQNRYPTLPEKVDKLFNCLQLHDVKGLWKIIRGTGSLAHGDNKHMYFDKLLETIIPLPVLSVIEVSKEVKGEKEEEKKEDIPKIEPHIAAKRRISAFRGAQRSFFKADTPVQYGLRLIMESYIAASSREFKKKNFDEQTPKNNKAINLAEWIKLLKDYSVLEENVGLDVVEVASIFKRYNSGNFALDAKWMVFETFIDCLKACACKMFPLPKREGGESPLSSPSSLEKVVATNDQWSQFLDFIKRQTEKVDPEIFEKWTIRERDDGLSGSGMGSFDYISASSSFDSTVASNFLDTTVGKKKNSLLMINTTYNEEDDHSANTLLEVGERERDSEIKETEIDKDIDRKEEKKKEIENVIHNTNEVKENKMESQLGIERGKEKEINKENEKEPKEEEKKEEENGIKIEEESKNKIIEEKDMDKKDNVIILKEEVKKEENDDSVTMQKETIIEDK